MKENIFQRKPCGNSRFHLLSAWSSGPVLTSGKRPKITILSDFHIRNYHSKTPTSVCPVKAVCTFDFQLWNSGWFVGRNNFLDCPTSGLHYRANSANYVSLCFMYVSICSSFKNVFVFLRRWWVSHLCKPSWHSTPGIWLIILCRIGTRPKGCSSSGFWLQQWVYILDWCHWGRDKTSKNGRKPNSGGRCQHQCRYPRWDCCWLD